jgi:hypothetical protein
MRAIFIFLFYSWETLEPTKLQREMENNIAELFIGVRYDV